MTEDIRQCVKCSEQEQKELILLWDDRVYCRACIIKTTGSDQLFEYGRKHPVYQEQIPLDSFDRNEGTLVLLKILFGIQLIGTPFLLLDVGLEAYLWGCALYWGIALFCLFGRAVRDSIIDVENLNPYQVTMGEGAADFHFQGGVATWDIQQITWSQQRLRKRELMGLHFDHEVVMVYVPGGKSVRSNYCMGIAEENRSVLRDFFLLSDAKETLSQKRKEKRRLLAQTTSGK